MYVFMYIYMYDCMYIFDLLMTNLFGKAWPCKYVYVPTLEFCG